MADRVATGIITNHDFSAGLEPWYPNACDALVVSSDEPFSSYATSSESSNSGYAVVTNRRESWHCLEQDITDRVSPGCTYIVSAWVGVSGPVHEPAQVQATLKIEIQGSATQFLLIGKTYASRDKWETLEGTFSLSSKPDRTVFYLEGPSPGTDLLIRSVTIKCSSRCDYDEEMKQDAACNDVFSPASNIIKNHDFSDGLHAWSPNCCHAFVARSPARCSELRSASGEVRNYAVVKNRKENWQGLEQDITGRVSPGDLYKVSAIVRVSGPVRKPAQVQATLKLEHQGSATQYLFIGKTYACKDRWGSLEGTFSFSGKPDRVVFYLEGPPPGIELLIQSAVIDHEIIRQPESRRQEEQCLTSEADHVFLNSHFVDGLNHWSERGCKLMLHDSFAHGKILPHSGNCFASATERMHKWSGIQQEVTGRILRKVVYEASALVRVPHSCSADTTLQATLWVKNLDGREEYIGISNVQAAHDNWVELKGKFLVNGYPSRVVVYIEGPPPGTDFFVDNFVVKRAEKIPSSIRPCIQDCAFGVNIVSNSQLHSGTIDGWFPLGNCQLEVGEGSPPVLPSLARDSLGPHGSTRLSGRYILTTNRSETWMGPGQIITGKVKLFVTYQVSAWVRVGSGGACGPQDVNVALSVDNRWVNGGKIEVNDREWHEITGSFRIEKKPDQVMVHVQGPSSGVDLMVAGLHIFPVDRKARLSYVQKQADKVRKSDVLLRFSGVDSSELSGATVKIRQMRNAFPLGACISRSSIENEEIIDFFLDNFNWAVFGNELKWYWTEPEQGNFNYRDADEMLRFCEKHNIQTRGHCIFWEVESTVQPWIQRLSKNELEAAVNNRLKGLLTQYMGKFRHYDVNNEMLHGSFYQERLGSDIRAEMFRTACQLDPSATLFMNEYHIEDGCDSRSSPEKYIQLVRGLQEKGAPVGGVGIQGHISSPVGQIVASALDKLSKLGLPIWFTELDVSSINEHVRGDDMEVMLWEAFAHPAVEGVMLWGFWELFMSREHSHLVNADGGINEAGRKFLEVKGEWLSSVDGSLSESGEFGFRGYRGTYTVEVSTSAMEYSKTFVVDNGDSAIDIIL
ncbi:PREDICTED: uncharacterized protein LOC104816770 isoform X2 [Tarenaya hassleriana]|nr:PREDICTED: uncharacterized protein LOC104816770 isoform X2 [Tarenaya hassleriana]